MSLYHYMMRVSMKHVDASMNEACFWVKESRLALVRQVSHEWCEYEWGMSLMLVSMRYVSMWMSHVSHEGYMSHMNQAVVWPLFETFHMSRVSHEAVMSCMNQSRLAWTSACLIRMTISQVNVVAARPLFGCCHERSTSALEGRDGDVSCRWVMSHMNESGLMWTSHVLYACGSGAAIIWVLPRTNYATRETGWRCLVSMSHVSHEWVLSYMNKSWHV